MRVESIEASFERRINSRENPDISKSIFLSKIQRSLTG